MHDDNMKLTSYMFRPILPLSGFMWADNYARRPQFLIVFIFLFT